MTNKNISLDWQFWFYWIMATTFGWVVGYYFFNVLPVIIAGGLISAFQAVVLYKRLPNVWQWMLLSFLGWMVGNIISIFFLPDEFAGLIMGLTTGFAQWIFLQSRVSLSGWWIIISVIGWVTGLSLMPGILTSGALPGAISGIALMLLLSPGLRKKKIPNQGIDYS